MKPYFTKLVKAGDRLRKFNFRKFSDPANFIHVDVSDEEEAGIFLNASFRKIMKIDDKIYPVAL